MESPKDIGEQVTSIFGGLSLTQKVIGGVILAAVLGGLLILTLTGKAKTGNYEVLFSNLTQEDAGEAVTWLRENRVPYQLANEGTAIMVPASRVHETRLDLAGAGLPRGGGVGFEIFDKTSLGTTDFVHRLNYQRALQGELARTIRQFRQIRSARVHIATPKESVFIEDQREPSASISLSLQGREKLSKNQIQAIVNLVACAVPSLTPENITVVDTAGRLLYRKEGEKDGLLSATQMEYQLRLEETMRRKVESMLEEVVGVGRAQARVTAEVDFTKVDVTEENFDPEGQVVRSEQLLTEADLRGGQSPEGIPGVKGELATFSESSDQAADGESRKRNNVTRNYEISKTIKHVMEPVGNIKRLSVAVMVDGTYEKVVDKDGKAELKYKQRTQEELQSFERITKNAIGFDEDRGDQVEVVGVSFALSSLLEAEETVMDQWRGLIEHLAKPLMYLLVVVVLLLFVVRPFFRMMSDKQLEKQRMAILSEKGIVEEEEDLTLPEKALTDRERIYRLAQSDPNRAADLVKRWLKEEY